MALMECKRIEIVKKKNIFINHNRAVNSSLALIILVNKRHSSALSSLILQFDMDNIPNLPARGVKSCVGESRPGSGAEPVGR